MEVKNIYIDNPGLLVEFLIRKLISKNISYVVINNDDNIEIHFDNYIYRVHELNEINQYETLMSLCNFKDSSDSFSEDSEISYSFKKQRPSFKRYTKNDIKKDNKNNKMTKNTKRKLSRHY